MKKLIAITLTAALALTGSFTASLTKTADAAAYTTKTNTQYTDTYTDTAVTYYRCKIKWHDLKVSQVHYEYES